MAALFVSHVASIEPARRVSVTQVSGSGSS